MSAAFVFAEHRAGGLSALIGADSPAFASDRGATTGV